MNRPGTVLWAGQAVGGGSLWAKRGNPYRRNTQRSAWKAREKKQDQISTSKEKTARAFHSYVLNHGGGPGKGVHPRKKPGLIEDVQKTSSRNLGGRRNRGTSVDKGRRPKRGREKRKVDEQKKLLECPSGQKRPRGGGDGDPQEKFRGRGKI